MIENDSGKTLKQEIKDATNNIDDMTDSELLTISEKIAIEKMRKKLQRKAFIQKKVDKIKETLRDRSDRKKNKKRQKLRSKLVKLE